MFTGIVNGRKTEGMYFTLGLSCFDDIVPHWTLPFATEKL